MKRAPKFPNEPPPEETQRKERRRLQWRLRQQRRRARLRPVKSAAKDVDIAEVLRVTGDLQEWDADDPVRVAEAMRKHFLRLRTELGLGG